MASRSHEQLDILFVSEHALHPVDQGFSIRGSNMVKAMDAMGIRVAVASEQPFPDEASDEIRRLYLDWPEVDAKQTRKFLKGWQGPGYRARLRIADYQGRDLERFAGVISLVEKHQPKTVIGLGQHSTMMLRALKPYTGIRKVWYAADELMYFQLSCMRREGLSTLNKRLQMLALYGGLETFFVRGMDGAVGVAPQEAKLLKYLAGAKKTTCIRNGVDTGYFAPPRVRPVNKQLVFWGRMDFEPNIDAVTWFSQNVWPQLHAKHPDAVLKVVGKNPTESIQSLEKMDGIEIVGAVPDIRPYVNDSSATVLPMRCGGGIKNKLLEAAAMGIPIVGSPKAVLGLEARDGQLPVLTCKTTEQWINTLERLWSDTMQSEKLSIELRQWVLSHHSWPNAAKQMLQWLDRLPCAEGHSERHTPLAHVQAMQSSVFKEAA